MQQFYDAVIVGAGPAGASCAVWLARLGLSPVLVEAGPRAGGLTADNPFADDWIVAVAGLTGQQIAGQIAESLEQAGVPLRLGAAARSVRPCKGGIVLSLADPAQSLHGRCLVIASGVRARGLPGHPPGVSWPGVLIGPGSPIVAQDYSGLSVAVLGGGDNAFENFVYVRNRGARQVHLYARSVRAQQQWVQRAGSAGVSVGAYEVDPAARRVNGQRYDLILVFYGWEPQADFADGLNLARDARGYIQTETATARTSLPDVYAIGEVANRAHPCVVTAMADGVVAAKDIQRRWERA
ncbi:NAD(P)/FAD-dependent oxidoreductase [Bordetella genomosp. 12]|uniref:Oxidoreductase n=1 Tax=Bordetella genomosp. 12 TaxID=463035 RepID=A0A261VUU1_9BORD|nr:NAD(P)/FAD-dependent oxidoreductase [Bordetella genomosp. 12]OZI77262.1 oxidoreductase [Bordetella genomosp. 12]